MTKLHRVLGALFTVLLLTSCQGQEASDTTQTSLPEQNTATTLTAWSWDTEFNTYALRRAEGFYQKDHPDFQLEIVEASQADIVQKMHVGLAAGSTGELPDILPVEDYKVGAFLASYSDRFYDMTDLVDYSLFAPYKQSCVTWKGRKYGIPWDSGAVVMYYRRDILEQAGYTEADVQDLTWDEYVEMAHAVKEKTGCYISSFREEVLSDFRVYMHSVGVWYIKEDGTPYFKDNPALEAGIELFVELLENDLSIAAVNRSEQQTYLYEGTIASIINGCWFTPTIQLQKEQSGLWMMAPLPRFDLPGAGHSSNTGGGAWYVIDDRPGSDLAMEFLLETFGGTDELYEALLLEKDIIATYLPTWESDVIRRKNEFFGGQQTALFVTQQAKNIAQVNYGLYTFELEEVLRTALQEVLNGKPVKKALEAAQVQAEALVGVS